MAHENQVLRSIETPDGTQCVDIFRRPDGSYGFESFRRDPETGHGWFPTSNFSSLTFANQEDAATEAYKRIPWLAALDPS